MAVRDQKASFCIGTFPFGQSVKRLVQQDRSPKKVFVLGVYASAVHARWIGPDGRTKVNALAVASEPYIFWRGEGAAEIIQSIAIPSEVGRLVPAAANLNGPSGVALDDLFLAPLGFARADAWLCDLVPYSCMNEGQKAAIDREYVPLMAKHGLPEPTTPDRPDANVGPTRRQEILAELRESKAELLVLLGDEPIIGFLNGFDGRWSRLSDFGGTPETYGQRLRVNLDGLEIDVLPLAHPRQAAKLGRSSDRWFKLHQGWIEQMNAKPQGHRGNLIRFSGIADTYDRYRPSPPCVLVDILTQLAETPKPELVVDIGSGTGLSTRLWAGRVQKVIGIEPNDDMRAEAERSSAGLPDVFFQQGTSTHTGLPDACADIVTVVQALHWMEPEPTFGEIVRVLRPGGVFAACDCDWPPTMHFEAEAAYRSFMARIEQLEEQHGLDKNYHRWHKHQHLDRMKASGQFRHVKEIVLHQVEEGNADRLIGVTMSMGSVAPVLKLGLTEDEIGLTALREAAQRFLGNEQRPWYFSYRVRVGVK